MAILDSGLKGGFIYFLIFLTNTFEMDSPLIGRAKKFISKERPTQRVGRCESIANGNPAIERGTQ